MRSLLKFFQPNIRYIYGPFKNFRAKIVQKPELQDINVYFQIKSGLFSYKNISFYRMREIDIINQKPHLTEVKSYHKKFEDKFSIDFSWDKENYLSFDIKRDDYSYIEDIIEVYFSHVVREYQNKEDSIKINTDKTEKTFEELSIFGYKE